MTIDQSVKDSVIKDSVKGGWVEHMPVPMRPYLRLSRYDRPIGFWLLALPGWMGLAFAVLTIYEIYLGGGKFDDLASLGYEYSTNGYWHEAKFAILIAIGAIAMRGAGCTYNDIVDQDLDAQVERTALRPLPAGTVTTKQAWVWLAIQCLIGLIVLSFFPRLSQITALSSLVLVAAYPFMKRITFWPQAWLGFTFNWAILVAFTASIPMISAPLIIFYLGLVFWTIGYDTIYACQDVEDDAMIGVKSTARLFGKRTKLGVGLCYTAAIGLIGYALLIMSHSIYSAGDYIAQDAINDESLPLGYQFIFSHVGAFGSPTYYGDYLVNPALLLVMPFALHLCWQVWKLDPSKAKLCLSLFKSNRSAGLLLVLGLAFPSLANLLHTVI